MADMANTINHQEARMNHEHHDVKDEVKQTGPKQTAPKQTAPKKLWVTPRLDYLDREDTDNDISGLESDDAAYSLPPS